jgi:hypothetical protein
MLKNILNLKGSQKLSDKEQKTIKGGVIYPTDFCGYKIVRSASEVLCLSQYANNNPIWLGNGQCSILGTRTDC